MAKFSKAVTTLLLLIAVNVEVFARILTSPHTSNKILEDGKHRFKGMPRIIGGMQTRIHEFPSIAFLHTIPNEKGKYSVCAATIIAPRVALTAAHCVAENPNPKLYRLRVGEHNIQTSEETDATEIMLLNDIIIHNHYDSSSFGVNDIALLITEKWIRFTPKVGPASLPFYIDKESIIGKDVIAAGWGKLHLTGKVSDTLQNVLLQVETDKNCKATLDPVYMESQHICALHPTKGILKGDSGGPLYYIDPVTGRHTLMGVTSYFDRMNDGSLFMNVHHYLPWINEKLRSVNY